MPALPTLRWQQRSQLNEDSVHSVLIALLRGMAALQVAAAHLRAEVFPGLRAVADPPLFYQAMAFATGFAHQAVVVFFLISGWLVGGSLLNKIGQPQAIRSYAIDRLTRLWTVLVPALLLMLAVGMTTQAVDPHQVSFAASNDFSVVSFIGNLFGLQYFLVPNFGGNYALWSLSNETWYYIQFPLLLLALTGRGVLRQAGAAAALLLIACWLPWAVTIYFANWLLGAAFSRIRIDCGTGFRALLVLATLGLAVYYRFKGSNDDLVPASFVQDMLCSLPFLMLLSSLQMRLNPDAGGWRRAGKVARFFSECSFTLYVTHVPLIALLRHLGRTWTGRDKLSPHAPLDYLIYAGMLVAIVVAAYLSYLLFESQTFRVRRKLKEMLLERTKSKAPVPAL